MSDQHPVEAAQVPTEDASSSSDASPEDQFSKVQAAPQETKGAPTEGATDTVPQESKEAPTKAAADIPTDNTANSAVGSSVAAPTSSQTESKVKVAETKSSVNTPTPSKTPVKSNIAKPVVREDLPADSMENLVPLLFWKDPVQSGLVFGIGCCVYFLVHFRGYSLLSLVAIAFGFNLCANALWILITSFLNPSVDCRARLVTFDQFAGEILHSPQSASVLQLVTQSLQKISNMIRADLLCPSILAVFRAGGIIFSIYVIGTFVSLQTLFFIPFVLAFTVPIVYSKNKREVDYQISQLRELSQFHVDSWQQKLYKQVPKSKVVLNFLAKDRTPTKAKRA